MIIGFIVGFVVASILEEFGFGTILGQLCTNCEDRLEKLGTLSEMDRLACIGAFYGRFNDILLNEKTSLRNPKNWILALRKLGFKLSYDTSK